MNNRITVSVCMITYGHENYIREAIESVLMQECDFEIELIIANDCSPDKTDTIVQEILENHSKKGIIKYFKHEKNLGMMPNFVFALNKCLGTYIAICDGDDYWIDPLKLRKQVDFLNKNPDFVIHSGNAIQLSEKLENNGKPIIKETRNEVFTLKDFVSNNNIIACTGLFRNMSFQFPESFKKITFGDWFLYVILIENTKSKSYRSSEIFSVYRIHDVGLMSNLSKLENYSAHIFQITTIYDYLSDKITNFKDYHKLNNFFIKKFRLLLREKMYFEAVKTFMKNFRHCKFNLPFKKYLSALKYNYLNSNDE